MNKGTFYIATGVAGGTGIGTNVEEVQGTIVGSSLGVHKVGSSWTITHLPTGLSAVRDIRKKTNALGLAEKLNVVKGINKGKFGKPEYLRNKELEPMKGIIDQFHKEQGD